MKLLRRHSGKAQHFDVHLLIETLTPWPSQHGALAIQYSRGAKRHGRTKPALPDTDLPSASTSYSFRQTLKVPATLYRTGEGVYEAKKLELFVAQVDDKGKELNVLGCVELDLGQLAGISGGTAVRQAFPVLCSNALWGPNGERPKLTLSIAVAREGQKIEAPAATLPQLPAEDSIEGGDTEGGLPSTLSTDQEDSTTDSYRPGAPSPALDSVREEEEETGDASPPSPGALALAAAAAAVESGVKYDADGFLVDSDLLDHPSQATQSAAAATALTGQTSGGAVKRDLRPAMDQEGPGEEAEVSQPVPAPPPPASPPPIASPPSSPPRPAPFVFKAASPEKLRSPTPASPSSTRESSSPEKTSLDGGQALPQQATHARRFSRGGDGAPGSSRGWAWKRQAGADGAVSPPTFSLTAQQLQQEPESPAAGAGVVVAPFGGPSPLKAMPSFATPDMAGGSLSGGPVSVARSAGATSAMERELLVVAALESAVFLAGRGWSRALSSRQPRVEDIQAPARRLARTIIIMGPEGGLEFGRRAVAAVRAAAAAALGDPHRLVLWWSNAVTLRWSFWALARGSGGGTASGKSDASSSGHFDWLARALGPDLLQLEAQLYADLVEVLWSGCVVAAAKQSVRDLGAAAAAAAAAAAGFPALESGGISPAFSGDRTMSNGSGNSAVSVAAALNGRKSGGGALEGAVVHWIAGLNAADAALSPPGRPPAAPRPLLALLRGQVMAGVLTALDRTMLDGLVAEEPQPELAALGPELLPSQGEPLTFATGVQLKMAAGRLVNWAADAGLRAAGKRDHSSHDPSRLLARLQEAADLLMVPKESLMDVEVRKAVAPSLPTYAVLKLLQRYQPEDPASDFTTPALMRLLRAEAASDGEDSIGEYSAADGYSPPVEEMLLEEGLVQPLSLDLSADSDDELSTLEEQGDRRFGLLRELWGGGSARD